MIDFRSAETVRESVAALTDGMAEEEREAFSQALARLIVSRHPETSKLDGLSRLSALAALGDNLLVGAEDFMGTVTKDDVLREARNLPNPKPEASSLSADPKTAKFCEVHLSNVKLAPSQFLMHLSFDATNDLDVPLRALLVNYRAVETGRTIPLIESEVWVTIPSGIEPGETKHITGVEIPLPKQKEPLQAHARVINMTDADNRTLKEEGLNLRRMKWEEGGLAITCPQSEADN